MRRFILSLFAAIMIAGASTALAQPNRPASRTYAVIFEATVGADGKVDALVVSKVIDPQSGSTAAVDVAVPDAFVAAVREELRERVYPTTPGRFFVYKFFNPARPDRTDISPLPAAR